MRHLFWELYRVGVLLGANAGSEEREARLFFSLRRPVDPTFLFFLLRA